MKRKNPIAFLIAWLGFALAPTHAVHAADGGPAAQPAVAPATLTGTVTNSATGRTLEGARVVLQGTGRETLTDILGAYFFADVAPGNVVLAVYYTGLNPQEVPVVVASGAPNRRNVGLTADIYTLSKFVVSGEREGNAQAITLQRESSGVKSIVSADAFGSLVGNPADLLIRLPGVEGESVDGDMRFIRIRGMSQNLLTVTMNGDRIASANKSSTNRDFEFSQSNGDAIERIEVVKSPTPDMDGDSIGGAINMVSKSAFDSSPERRFSGSIGASWLVADPRDKPHTSYTFGYTEVFAGRLGVSLTASYRGHASLSYQNTLSYEQLPDTVAGPAYTNSVAITDFRNMRVRSGISLKLDYKFSDSTRFYINSQYSKYNEHESGTLATWSTAAAVATRDASGNFTGTGAILPGYTETMTDVRSVTANTLTLRSGNLFQDGSLRNIQVGGVHRYKNLNIDYSAYSSLSKVNYVGVSQPSFIIRNIGFRIDRGDDDGFYRTVLQTAGADWTKIASYTENAYSDTPQVNWDHIEGAALNVKKQFETPVPTYIKAGVRWRGQTRRLENRPWTGTWVGPDGVMGVNPATGINDDNLGQFMAYRPLEGKLARYGNLPFPYIVNGADKFQTARRETPQYFQQNLAANIQSDLTGTTRFEEGIGAYYIMGNVDIGKLSILGGVRVETTNTEGEGSLQVISPAEKARRAAWVGPVTVAEDVRRRIAEFGSRQTRTGENRVVLPGLHFKFSPLPMLVTRLSYATNIGRPGIGQLIPRTNVDYDSRTVSSSNPSLLPQTANNFDLTAEYYFEPAGVFSAGVFLKELKRFIYTAGGAIIPVGADNGFDGEYAGFAYTTQYNGGFAKVKGIELSYYQQFSFLPGFWSGFGAFANATRMQAEGNYGNGNSIALAPSPKIAGFNPLTGNLGVSYIKNRVTLRFQGNYRGRYLVTYNVNQSRMVYARARPTLDIKSSYNFSKRFDAYFDVTNVTMTKDYDRGVGEIVNRAQSIKLMYPQFTFGINGRM